MTTYFLRYFSTILSLFLISTSSIFAQHMPGESFTITSEFMGEERKIQVALPKQYNEWTSYDVQYMLDPVWNMDLRKSLLDFMQNNTMAPRTILVGIVSTDRNADMTPTRLQHLPTTGNADNFIQFVAKEVKPFIESKYKTSGHNTFAGHSFGGLCVMYSFLKQPEVFDAYLIGDPSFWYDDQLLIKLAEEKLPSITSGKVVFIGARKGNAYKGMGIEAMETILKKKAHESLDWKIVAYEDETHNSVIYKLNYDGIKFIAEDFRNKAIKFIPNEGEIIPGEPITLFLGNSNAKTVKYTTDGSEPDFSDKDFKDSISLAHPATLKIKVPLKRGNLLPAVKGKFVEGQKLKGIKKSKKFVRGLNYKYYEVTLNKLPQFDTLQYVRQGELSEGFNLKSLPKQEDYACVFEGYFEAKESGYHYFALSSNDGMKFYIHNKLMINNDWRHAAFNDKSTVVYLEKGLHPIKYEYFQFKGKYEINLKSYFPGEKPGPTDFNRFWRKK